MRAAAAAAAVAALRAIVIVKRSRRTRFTNTSLVLSLACQQMRGYYSSPKHPFVPPILGVVGLLLSAALVGGAARGIENLDLKVK